jgi:CBS domain-containing protein
MMNRPVIELCQPHVWSILPDDPIDAIGEEMVARRLTWAPVLDSRATPIGVISAWDLLHMQAGGKPGNTPAWQACTYKPLTVPPDTSAEEAARLMREAHVHHLLVVSEQGKMLGVLSSLDLLAAQEQPTSK